ncbi:MAG TPA: hypothetical protein PLG09_02025 [Syntrophomonadaceae bacterium]|nr:hypothetical protein [Syntrophomonadaceae bacterium]HOQ08883.1 hypothetical protein [Syntrophomonadaceae bacterium]HPU47694.1 hypothetical protein [Syntrophomonadaceae bacterium]
MDSSNGLELFISILLTYSELHAVRYDADNDVLSWQIAVQEDITPDQEKDLLNRFEQSWALYHKMAGVKASISRVHIQRLRELTFLHFERDMSTMSVEEIGLLLDLTRDIISNRILYDTGDFINEKPIKDTVKQNLLRRISKSENKHQFFAFRKQGKVLVFQK